MGRCYRLGGVGHSVFAFTTPSSRTDTTTVNVESNQQPGKHSVPLNLAMNDELLTFEEVPSNEKAEASKAGTKGAILAYVKSRNHILAIYSSDNGPRFDVSTRDGKLLVANVSLDELATKHPELYQSYKSGYANAWAGLNDSASKVPPAQIKFQESLGIPAPTEINIIEAR